MNQPHNLETGSILVYFIQKCTSIIPHVQVEPLHDRIFRHSFGHFLISPKWEGGGTAKNPVTVYQSSTILPTVCNIPESSICGFWEL